jgi:hypothetical protein
MQFPEEKTSTRIILVNNQQIFSPSHVYCILVNKICIAFTHSFMSLTYKQTCIPISIFHLLIINSTRISEKAAMLMKAVSLALVGGGDLGDDVDDGRLRMRAGEVVEEEACSTATSPQQLL